LDPWDDWRKRRKAMGFPDDVFAGMEAEMERMRAMMNRFLEEASKAAGKEPGEPFVYGFSMRMTPDGKPQFQEFGNTRPFTPAAAEGREPLTDVIESKDAVSVTAELPGVEKKDINLHVAERKITIKVAEGRKYHKEIALPAAVVPDSAKATYKNGILDITIRRAGGPDDSGHRVQVQ
jgi:HSP20 family protein